MYICHVIHFLLQYCLSATLSVTPNVLDKVNDVILTHSQTGRTRALITQLSCMEWIIMSGCGLLDQIGMAILSDAVELSDEQVGRGAHIDQINAHTHNYITCM